MVINGMKCLLLCFLGNKSDDKSKREVQLNYAKDFVNNNDIINMFAEVSAKNDLKFG